MSLDKNKLNLVLDNESTRPALKEGRIQDTADKSVDEMFIKRNTILGQQDGEVVGGIKSLGQTCNSSEEVITGHVGSITDEFPTTGV